MTKAYHLSIALLQVASAMFVLYTGMTIGHHVGMTFLGYTSILFGTVGFITIAHSAFKNLLQ